MQIRPVTPTYAVSPQIAPEDMSAIRDAGYVAVICNRPDEENPPEWQAAAMERGNILLEASGGINLATLRDVAATGIDMISVGALTHSPRSIDFGLDFHRQ